MNNLGLYLHFPFCRAKCGYCDFYSTTRLSLIPAYEKALCHALLRAKEKCHGRVVDTVYLGGGTPSLLTVSGIEEIFSTLHRSFSLSRDAEITMEMNPESATEEKLLAAKKAGVNRLSFGMQSCRDQELCALGRLHLARDVEEAVERARKIGFDNVSLDLMYGLPGQKIEDFKKSLERCVALSPEHISFYCLTLSPQVPLYARRHLLPGEEEVRKMYLVAHAFLEEMGYEHYEISNAARPGYASRHNLRYWQGKEYLGIGPGAHSYFENKRFSLPPDLDLFLSTEDFFQLVEEEEFISPGEKAKEYLLLAPRLKSGVAFEKVEVLFGKEKRKEVEEKALLWSRYGLCHVTETGFFLTPEGFFVSNEIISELM